MKYLKMYNHRKTLLRHGAEICGACNGEEGEMMGRDYWTAKWRPCQCNRGLYTDELKVYVSANREVAQDRLD
jgi:hypothetical protein